MSSSDRSLVLPDSLLRTLRGAGFLETSTTGRESPAGAMELAARVRGPVGDPGAVLADPGGSSEEGGDGGREAGSQPGEPASQPSVPGRTQAPHLARWRRSLRQLLGDGEAQWRALSLLAAGHPVHICDRDGQVIHRILPKGSDVVAANALLWDRAWGKVPSAVALADLTPDHQAQPDLADLSDHEREVLQRIARRRLAALGEAASGDG